MVLRGEIGSNLNRWCKSINLEKDKFRIKTKLLFYVISVNISIGIHLLFSNLFL